MPSAKTKQRRARKRRKTRDRSRHAALEIHNLPRLSTDGASELMQGRFYPELALGAGALSSNRAAELQQFLVAVVRQRGCPLHLANLWNALYFNYDLAHWGFRLDHLEQKRIPTRTAQVKDFSLPVGGFVRVHTEAACGDLFAEVIYKEGAHPSVEEDWLEPKLSGAPASADEDVDGNAMAIVRERFVLDLDTFGPDANDITPKQYERLCRRALWLDEHGHLLMEAMYTPQEADLEDLDYYADYLLREHRDGLLAFCFDEDLTDAELHEALLRSFAAVRELAIGANELRSWRGKYFFTRSSYEERVGHDGPLGEGDLGSLMHGLAHVASGRRSCYAPIGPRIVEILKRDGLAEGEDELLHGPAYAAAVCYANTYIADTLAKEQRDGVLRNGIHLRLDDDWLGGGIWRAERVPADERYSLKAISPLLPLALGYSSRDSAGEASEHPANDEQPIASSQTGFKAPLTLRDRALSRLRLSASAATSLAPGAVEVVVRYGDARIRSRVEREGRNLYGVEYPWELHPGVVLACNVESGGSVVRVRTLPVTPPIEASDGTRFDVETNLGLYEREMGLEELPVKEKSAAPTLRELINRAFRLRGRARADGARSLTISGLATVVLGPGWRAEETRPLVQALAGMKLERDGADYLWRPRVSPGTRSSDRSLLEAYGETGATCRLGRAVRRHWVPMHLRRYTEQSERSPSDEKRRTYAEARASNGMHGVLPEELPADCTWVGPHDRGGEDDPTNGA